MKFFQLPNPTEFTDIRQVINRLVELSIQVVGVVAVLSLMLSGLRYIMAGGDEKKAAEARNSIVSTIIGTVVVVVAYLIVKFVLVEVLNVRSSLLGDWLTE